MLISLLMHCSCMFKAKKMVRTGWANPCGRSHSSKDAEAMHLCVNYFFGKAQNPYNRWFDWRKINPPPTPQATPAANPATAPPKDLP
ncbi:MAG: hypothetical protein ACREWI_07740 [Telluria sp.]